jgi:hypothetical protein
VQRVVAAVRRVRRLGLQHRYLQHRCIIRIYLLNALKHGAMERIDHWN